MKLPSRLLSCVVLLSLTCISCMQQSSADSSTESHYKKGSVIETQVTIQDALGAEHRLLDVIKSQDKPVTVVYIFGGGAMGAKVIGRGIWCQDSYEDLHILRTLVDVYSDRVGFVAIAEPPVFHTKQMGFEDRALLDYSLDDDEYKNAYNAFVKSNQEAFDKGTIPIQPYMDIGFRLLMNEAQQDQLGVIYGDTPDWQGSFRAPNDKQTYGVPAFWIVDQNGKVLTEPYRGNIYHPHGGSDITLNYSLIDMVNAINASLSLEKE